MACAPPVPQSVVPVSNFYPNRPVPPGDFWHQLVPQDATGLGSPRRDRMRQWSASLIPGALGTVIMALCSRGAMIHVDRIPRRPKAGRPNLQIRSLLPRLETGVGGVDGGDNGLQAEQRVREARQAVNRGAVLPESQAQFLEEIVELSSEHGSSTMQEGAPTPRKQRAKSAAPVTTQQPLTDVQPAPSESGGLSDSTGGPPPVPVMCSVATMTDQRPLSPGGWGEIVKEDEDSHPPAYGSPKMRRTQGRLRVPHLQEGECAARYPGGSKGDSPVGGKSYWI
ncbi:hypothetical protein Q5P01_000630 [Channa striata]|uniref:Uncharacterized protein n=1 Tax=Channa striata TaxID=64152 RepID=A0AA88IDC8_CHASR|nr:hypothetical protein Q5P01_000630 [Channa striata]